MLEVIGLGAGSHCGVVIDALLLNKTVSVVGLLDVEEGLWGTNKHGVNVIGGDKQITELVLQGITHCFIGIGGTTTTEQRAVLFNKATALGLIVINTIHPSAIISDSVIWGDGVTILAGAIINANARIGSNVLINTGAIVEHDCQVYDNVHIATAAKLAGSVTVGKGTHIGIGATVKENLNIGTQVIVGAGAVVITDVPDYTTVVGVPAKPITHGTSSELL